jgi:hypothetical protein
VIGRIHDEVDQDLACDGYHALPFEERIGHGQTRARA